MIARQASTPAAEPYNFMRVFVLNLSEKLNDKKEHEEICASCW